MKHRLFRQLILLTFGLLIVLRSEAFANEQFPYPSVYEEAAYTDRSAESEEEQKIYSFVQTTWHFYPDLRWTGPWSYIKAGGQEFFYFGCGICCLTNIYDTVTGDVVPPSTMYQWCRKYTDYNPDTGRGALSWGQLSEMCRILGLEATVHKKKDYSDFVNDMKDSQCMLVLVSKDGKGSIWPDTNGHYVTLWLYDSPGRTVFVTDSSGLRNRTRVSLSDVYKSLKSSSQYQYITIKKPDEPDQTEEAAETEETDKAAEAGETVKIDEAAEAGETEETDKAAEAGETVKNDEAVETVEAAETSETAEAE